MTSYPTFRDFLKASWRLLRRDTERKLKTMAQVRPELMRVVHSTLTDEEAVERMRPVVEADRRAATATLEYVTETREHFGGYITDRAYRVLVAAIRNTPPEPVNGENAELFEREKQLGWTPLESAFNKLAVAVPELVDVANASRSGMKEDQAARALIWRVQELVGPRAAHTDPLVRSSLASHIVANYLSVLEGKTDALDPTRPVWEYRRLSADRQQHPGLPPRP
jgi:hypothetical protein